MPFSGRKRIGGIVAALTLLGLIILTQPLFRTSPPRRDAPPQSSEPTSGDTLSRDMAIIAESSFTDAVDRILESAPWGNIAFSHPESMTLKETRVVELLLDLDLPVDSLKQRIQSEGKKLGAPIRVFPRMRAELISKDFDIAALTPPEQLISHIEPTMWKWQILPLKKGAAMLHLTLSAPIEFQGSTTMRVVRVFERNVWVRVTLGQRIGEFIGNNWQWLWASVLLPLGGWLWRKRRKQAASAK